MGMKLDANGLAVTGGSITTDKDMTAQGTVTGQTDVMADGISGRAMNIPSPMRQARQESQNERAITHHWR
ncbi:hypothetical protein RAA17_12335 [Komagataeibacter rhaeticus]|nr:hypothetical protein [Komagataeibacter rhaeticus]